MRLYECSVHAGHISFHQDVLVGDTMPPFDTQDLPQVPLDYKASGKTISANCVAADSHIYF